MARVAAEPQNSREAEVEGDAPARDRASVVSAVRIWRRWRQGCHRIFLSKTNELRSRGNGRNEDEKWVLTIDYFEDTENFNNLSVGAEAILDSVKEGYWRKRKIKRRLGGSTFI